MVKAVKRLKILDVLLEEQDYSDVIREGQEIVELSQKAMLRRIGIDPPKWHDVGSLLLEHQDRFDRQVRKELIPCASISKRLRKERELSFYGDIDFIPTEEYSKDDALQTIQEVKTVVTLALKVIPV